MTGQPLIVKYRGEEEEEDEEDEEEVQQ